MKTLQLFCISAMLVGVTTSCSSLRSANSPDVLYDTDAEAARDLQVPPDLTDVSNNEQFILPGTSGGPVTRNTLLPQFSNVRFEREGAQSWLAFEQAPEDIWPQLLAFARKEKYKISQTEPVAGVIVTQWRPASAVAKGSLLKNLIGGDEAFSRVAFRLERNESGTESGSRLFARSQAGSEKLAQATDTGDALWPAASHDPEATGALLSRLLVFLGVEEQKARGIINQEQARAVLDDSIIVTSGSGSQLIMHQGFQPAFSAVLAAIQSLDFPVTSSDDGVGRIEFADSDNALVIELTPTHISEVRVSVTDPAGARLPDEQEQALLNALLAELV